MANNNRFSLNVNASVSAWGSSQALNLRSDFVGRVRGVVAGAGPLDYAHISSDGEIPLPLGFGRPDVIKGRVTLYEGGARVAKVGPGGGVARGGGLRGVVRGMSHNSRRRLRYRLMACAWEDYLADGRRSTSGRSAFVTLTYPGDWSDYQDWQSWKVHLKRFRQRLQESSFRPLGVVWKLEFQVRGAPHFHLVFWWDNPVNFASFKAWVLYHWSGAVSAEVDVERKKHSRWGADVRPLYGSARGVQGYLSKYISKVDDVPACIEGGTGRVWGVWWSPPDGHMLSVAITSRAEWYTLIRRVRRWGRASWYLRKFRSGAVYGPGLAILQLLRGLSPSPLSVESTRVCDDGRLMPHLIL